MSHDPLDHGRRTVMLASGAAVALGWPVAPLPHSIPLPRSVA